jgi:hypothetical protein
LAPVLLFRYCRRPRSLLANARKASRYFSGGVLRLNTDAISPIGSAKILGPANSPLGWYPPTSSSGKHRECHQRWACTKHLRYAVHLFSEHTITRLGRDLLQSPSIRLRQIRAHQRDGDPDGLFKSFQKHRSEQRDQEQRLALKKLGRKRVLDQVRTRVRCRQGYGDHEISRREPQKRQYEKFPFPPR